MTRDRNNIAYVIGAILGTIFVFFKFIENNLLPKIASILSSSKTWDLTTYNNVSNLISNIIVQNIGFLVILFILTLALGCLHRKINKVRPIYEISLALLLGIVVTGFILSVLPWLIVFFFWIIGLVWGISELFSLIIRPVLSGGFYIVSIIVTKVLHLDFAFEKNLSTKLIDLYLQFLVFALIVPYIYQIIVKLFIRIFRLGSDKALAEWALKPLRLVTIEVLRITVYLFLFLIYSLSYITTVNIELIVIRESLLAYVLLDNVIYYIYSFFREKKKKSQCMCLEVFESEIETLINAVMMFGALNEDETTKIKLLSKLSYDKLMKKFANHEGVLHIGNELELMAKNGSEPVAVVEKLLEMKYQLIKIRTNL